MSQTSLQSWLDNKIPRERDGVDPNELTIATAMETERVEGLNTDQLRKVCARVGLPGFIFMNPEDQRVALIDFWRQAKAARAKSWKP